MEARAEELKKRVEELKKQTRDLEERVKKLEAEGDLVMRTIYTPQKLAVFFLDPDPVLFDNQNQA